MGNIAESTIYAAELKLIQRESYSQDCKKKNIESLNHHPHFPVFGSKSPCSVRIQENTDQRKLRTWTLFT